MTTKSSGPHPRPTETESVFLITYSFSVNNFWLFIFTIGLLISLVTYVYYCSNIEHTFYKIHKTDCLKERGKLNIKIWVSFSPYPGKLGFRGHWFRIY